MGGGEGAENRIGPQPYKREGLEKTMTGKEGGSQEIKPKPSINDGFFKLYFSWTNDTNTYDY